MDMGKNFAGTIDITISGSGRQFMHLPLSP